MTVQETEMTSGTLMMVTFDIAGGLDLYDIRNVFSGLYDLFTWASYREHPSRFDKSIVPLHPLDVTPNVRRVSYNSPLEVVLAINGGIAAVALTANRILAMWDRLQLTRTRHTGEALTRLALDIMREELEVLRGRDKLTRPDERALAERAAWVLSNISELKVEER